MNTTIARLLWVVTLLAIVGFASPSRAQDDDDDEQEKLVPQQNMFWANDEQFEQWLLGNKTAAGVRAKLESLLSLQIEGLDRACGLTEAQKTKLLLAGRCDIKHLFEQLAEKKRKYLLIKNDRNKLGQILQDVRPLQIVLNSGPFDGETIFSKAIKKTLDESQAEKYEKLLQERRQFRYRAKIELAVETLDGGVGLRADQRKKLVALLLAETWPPKKFGQYDNYVVMLQIARLPDASLSSILDAGQLRLMSRSLAQAKQMEPFLKTNGFIDADPPAVDPSKVEKPKDEPAKAKK